MGNGNPRRRRRRRFTSVELLEDRRLLHAAAGELPIENGLVLRLVADSGVNTIGETVTSWEDASGNGNDLETIAGNPRLVHDELNGRDVVRLAGLNDRLGRQGLFSLPTGNEDRTVFVVSDYQTIGWSGFVYGAHAGNASFGVTNSPTGHFAIYGFHTANNFPSDVIALNGGWSLQSAKLENGELSHYVNGNLVDSFQHTFATGNDGIRIGGTLADRTFRDLDVAEVVVFDRALSESEHADMQAYFQATYFSTQSQYRRELVAGSFAEPLAMESLPDGSMLVAQRRGGIRLVDLSVVPANVSDVVDLPNVETEGEQGVLDIALDPNFSSNGLLYVYYSHAPTNRNRVSSFVISQGEIDLQSEVMIWQTPTVSTNDFHHGGSLNFGLDGMLYITTGDEFTQDSQNLTHHRGKVLRINADGTIPSTNPFVDSPANALDEIYAYGLRNAYRARIDSVTGDMYIGDVGANDQQTAIEEVNRLEQGANYGWPRCQGSCGVPGMTNPVYQYAHAGSGAAVVVGDVYYGNEYPDLDGRLLIGDYVRGTIRALEFDEEGVVVSSDLVGSGLGAVVDIHQGADGKIYYVDITGGLHRFEYDPTGQLPVIQQATADVAGNQVTFQATATGVGTLSYLWNFGDGEESTLQNPTHEYAAPGVYSARLMVSNEFGSAVSDDLEITIGSTPDAEILFPAAATTFRAGDTIQYGGLGVDSEGTPLVPEQYSWRVRFIHNEHFHPAHGPHDGVSGEFTVPSTGHDFTGATGYRIDLTVTDNTGTTAVASVDVLPEKVNLTIDSDVRSAPVLIDGVPIMAPYALDTLIGFEHQLEAPLLTCHDGSPRPFLGWSDGGERVHQVTAPETDSTIVAQYEDCSSDIGSRTKLAAGAVEGVRSDVWTTVQLSADYDSMVVVATPAYQGTAAPAVVRVRSAVGNSFQLKLDRVDGSQLETSADVNYFVVEEGVYNEAEDGIKLEAKRVISSSTDRDDLWNGMNVTGQLENQYQQAVVVGQVITHEDADWSVFWSRGPGGPSSAARANGVWVGKHVGEDADTVRSNETIGYVVFEAGTATLGELSVQAFSGAKSLYGWPRSGGLYESDILDPVSVVASQTGMTGRNGSWSVVSDVARNANDTATLIRLFSDEDTLADAERAHLAEMANVVVFGAASDEPTGVNSPPTANDDTYTYAFGSPLTINAANGVLSNDVDADTNDLLTATVAIPPSAGQLTLNADGSFQYIHDGSGAADEFEYIVSDGNGGSSQAVVSLNGQEPSENGAKLAMGTLVDVSTSAWTTVTLPYTYESMVVVATPQYGAESAPVVTRIQQATGDQFQIRLSRTDSVTTPVQATIRYFVVEAGVYTEQDDGLEMEALRVTSDVTDRAGLWRGQSIKSQLQNDYAQPVVVGQVMTYNDPRWSTFWTRGSSASNAPSAAEIRVGKHVGEDPATTRMDEQLGVVVIEAGRGRLGDKNLIAGVGAATIGPLVGSGGQYHLSTTGLESAVVSLAGMRGGQGGWAVIDDNDAVTLNTLNLAVDEDQARDDERNHVAEQVAYLAFEFPPEAVDIAISVADIARWGSYWDEEAETRKLHPRDRGANLLKRLPS